jgi:hypothetical protein
LSASTVAGQVFRGSFFSDFEPVYSKGFRVMVINWLHNLIQQFSHSTGSRRRTKRRPAISQFAVVSSIEALESRQLLTMLAATNVAPNITANDVQVADINGDGKPDLLALSSTAVSVQLGNGDGTFQSAISSASGGYSLGMNIADYNKDGKLDIATNNGSGIDILFGNGDGSFQLPVVYAVGAYANDIESGDFNNDGFCDIVTASGGYGGTSQLLLNSGTGTFPTTKNIAISALGQRVEVGDLNNDGNLDLVESGNYSIGIYMGQGDGTFKSAGAMSGAYANGPMLADFNKDGKLDFATTSGTQLQVYTGNGAGGFLAPTNYVIAPGTSIEAADLNADGNPDILSNSGQVAFGRGDGTFYSPATYTLPGVKLAVGDFNGDGGTDIVSTSGAFLAGVSVSLNANNDATVLAGAVGIRVTTPDVVAAGVPFTVTVSVVDADGNVVPGFTGTVGVSGSTGSQPVSYTFTAADAGSKSITTATTLYTSGLQTVTATSPFLPASLAYVHVTPASVARFSVTAQPSAIAGQPADLTVTVDDIYGNPVSGYLGTIHFSSSDIQAGLPADYKFTDTDNGTHTFSATLKTAGFQTVQATDTIIASLKGVSTPVTVTPIAASTLSVSGGGGYVGSANPVTVTARDIYGNVDTNYSGTVHLASSDPNTTVSADVTLANGVGSFTATSVTVGAHNLTATDTVTGALVASETIFTTPGWAVRFTATPLASTVAGQSQGTTVTAYDAFGNVSTVFTGTVVVSGTDPQLFSYYTFTAADAGVHTIPVVLKTAGTQSVTIKDLYNPAVSVTQSGIQVTAAAAASIATTALTGTTAGVAQSFTVTVRDAYGNLATGYRGILSFSSSDVQAVLPAGYTFTAADAGTHTFSMTFKSAGGQTFTVADAANPGILTFTTTQKDIPIVAGAVVGLSARISSNVTAGVAFSVTISAVDAFGNPVPSYTGKIHFTGPAGSGNLLPADYTFTAADSGSHIFSATLTSTGTQTIGFADMVTGSIKGSASVKVVAASTSGGGGGGGTATGGTATGGTATGGGGSGGGKKVVV